MIIICQNCGEVKTYKIIRITTKEVVYKRFRTSYLPDDSESHIIGERYSKPKCPKCGRLVKFVKDEESEIE